MFMNVLSLFNGMSCGMLALKKAGIKVDKYYSSEIDKYSNQVSQKNFPEIIQIGDVTKVSGFDYDIDLLIAGSPCQGFSFAGKQLNFEDPRSKLFFEFVRILGEIRTYNPDVKFLLENVKMKKEYEKVITDILGVHPIEINSSLVSAQNRKRLYWTNIPNIEQPADKGILLKYILEDIIFDKISETLNVNPSGRGMNGKIHTGEKSPCLTTNKGEGGKIIQPSTTDNVTTLNPKKIDGSQTYQQDRIYGIDGKMVCLSAELSGRFNIAEIDYITRATVQANAEHSYNGKCPTLTAAAGMGGGNVPLMSDVETGVQNKGKYIDGVERIKYRKLTPIECERLQTVPDNFTDCVSNSQRYKMLGNGWTVDVIAHIFKNIGQEPKIIEPTHKPQLALF